MESVNMPNEMQQTCVHCTTLMQQAFPIPDYLDWWYPDPSEPLEKVTTLESLSQRANTCGICRAACDALQDEIRGSNATTIDTLQFEQIRVRMVPRMETNEKYRLLLEAQLLHVGEFRATLKFISSKHKAFSRPYWSSSKPLDLAARLPVVIDWLKRCESAHGCHADPTPELCAAARLIQVSSKCGILHARLVPGHTIGRQSRYLTLSHCWGDSKIIQFDRMETKKDNVKSRAESINIALLPRTFHDAIAITEKIGFSYLWIDSLCIIQDSDEDWQTEAAKMSEIYRNSFITLSATSARHSDEGCGFPNMIPPSLQVRIPSRENDRNFSIRREGDREGYSTTRALKTSPLCKRGWILQETLLSRRILHLTEEQLIWQCPELWDSEDTFTICDLIERVSPVYKPQSSSLMENYWWEWMEQYTQMSLTVPSDIYAALAGVIGLYKKTIEQDIVLGLREHYLVEDLPWIVSKGKSLACTTDKPRYPSWTWMSYPLGSAHIKGPIYVQSIFTSLPYYLTLCTEEEHVVFEQLPGPYQDSSYRCQVRRVQVQWTGEALTSLPLQDNCSLSLFGKLFRPQLGDTATEYGWKEVNGYGSYRYGHAGWNVFMDPDSRVMEDEPKDLTILALATYLNSEFAGGSGWFYWIIVGIVVRSTGAHKQGVEQYRRIGAIRGKWPITEHDGEWKLTNHADGSDMSELFTSFMNTEEQEIILV